MVATIHKGYKQTEVGQVPKDWDVKRIGDVLKVRHGKSQKDVAHPFGAYPILASGGVIGRASEYLYDKPSVLIGRKGTIDVPQYADAPFWTIDTLFYTAINENIDPKFIFYKFNLIDWYTHNEASGVPSLNAGTIERILIALPPTKDEQHSIAAALSDIDALIQKTESVIEKKKNVKRATMQSLLTGKSRLPGFKGVWEVKRIIDFTDCTAGGTPTTSVSEYWGGSIKWMNSGELNNKFIYDVEGRITEVGLKNSSTKVVPANSILIGLAGQGKTRGTAAISRIPLCTNQSIAAIFPADNFVPEYLYYNLDYRYEELRGLSTGGEGRGGLNLTIIRSLLIPFPKKEEQKAIASVLTDLDMELDRLNKKLEKYRVIKAGMMQQLLTGKIRI